MNTATAVLVTNSQEDGKLRLAVAAYLARYKGRTRDQHEANLRYFVEWCIQHNLEPFDVERPHIELYLRWMQEVRNYRPATVSQRLSAIVGFYRVCVIDGALQHSPADYVRRPQVPAESPTLGLSHLQFEGLLAAARESANPNDFALVCMLGLLGLRIFEGTGADVESLSEVHGHRVLSVRGKGDKPALVPLPPAVGRAFDLAITGRGRVRSCAAVPATAWTVTAPPGG